MVRAILKTGLLVGTLDALAAIINFIIPTFRNPLRIFQYIASGVFGRDVAFADEWFMPFTGLIFHYFIATVWTAFYFVLYLRIGALEKRPVLTGLLYGMVVWAVMNQLVVPLSRVPPIPFNLKQALIGASILMFAVGLPIAIAAQHFFKKRPDQSK